MSQSYNRWRRFLSEVCDALPKSLAYVVQQAALYDANRNPRLLEHVREKMKAIPDGEPLVWSAPQELMLQISSLKPETLCQTIILCLFSEAPVSNQSRVLAALREIDSFFPTKQAEIH